MIIDFQKEREAIPKMSRSRDRAFVYLNELEATSREADEQRRRAWAAEEALREATVSLEATRKNLEAAVGAAQRALDVAEQAQAELKDQRARDIRAMAFHRAAYHGYEPGESEVYLAAQAYDRLAAIHVPPRGTEVSRG